MNAYVGEAAGNGAKAAIMAGVPQAGARVWATRALKKPNVAATIANISVAIANQPLQRLAGSIADATERREILTGWARDKENPIAALKATDILNKMDGLYIQKHEHTGADGEPIRTIVNNYVVPAPPVDAPAR